jgi:hypothetical protein
MPRAGFEPVTPVLKRSKTVRVLDGVAIGTGLLYLIKAKYEPQHGNPPTPYWSGFLLALIKLELCGLFSGTNRH